MVEDTTSELAGLLASDRYRAALDWHVQRGLKIVVMNPSSMLTLAAKAVAAAQKSVADLGRVLDVEPAAFNLFVAAKLSQLSPDGDEDYPPGERPPKEERPRTIAVKGYPESFLIPHLCEFAVASSGEAAEVEQYAKRYRLPKAKQYAKDVVRWVAQARADARTAGAR